MEISGEFSSEQWEKSLSHLWNQFVSSQNNKEKFTEYLDAFTRCYSSFINTDFDLLDSQGFKSTSHLDVPVPDELLPSLKYRLMTCAEEKLVSEQQIQDAILLLQSLIILRRNARTKESVASTDFIKHVLLICDTALDGVCSKESRDHQLLLSFVHFSLHYLECLYDPSFKWRLSLNEQNQESFCKPASLDMHIVPFIYECFQRSQPDTGIQLHLLHLFGAIISGSQTNSLKAICPATVDILMRVLQGAADQYSSGDHVQHLTSLILRCLVTTMHAIHRATPEERQVEVGAVLDSYFQVLLKFCDSNNISLQLTMLEKVETMFSVSDKSSLQNTFMASGVCRQLLSFIRAIRRCPLHCQTLSTAAIRVFGLLLANSRTAKERFIQMIGYDNLFEALRNLGQPSRPLLISLLELVSEKKLSKDDGVARVKNSPVVIMLVKWLPDVDLELQSWLSTSLYQMCTADTWSLTQCCNSGINSAIIECLQKRNTLDTNTVGDLLDLLEATGSQFISQTDLKQLLRIFKSEQGKRLEVWMEQRLLKAMSKMADSENKQIPATYFQFNSPDHGIMTTSMGRWSGSGFSFHAWICLESPPSSLGECGSARRQLYNIQMSGGSGFEAFFTSEAVLVVSVFSKKERHDIPVMDCPIVCQKWYCIDVVHTSSKRPFGQSQLYVYVDEVLHVSANLKFPALGDDVVLCKIGCGSEDIGSSGVNLKYSGMRTGNDLSPCDSKQFPSAIDNKSKSSRFWPRWSFRNSNRSSLQSQPESDGMHGDGQEVRHGTVVSLFGRLSEVIIFMDSLIDAHVQSLFRLGPNRHLNQMKDGGVPADLPVKPLLIYHAKASFQGTCLDLSGNGHHAKVAGHLCSASNIKEVINTIGGVQLLFFLLDEAAIRPGASTDLISLEDDLMKNNGRLREEMDTLDPFFVLLRSFIQSSMINQEALLHNDGIAALGVILQKASASLLDHKFHESLKSFVSILPHSADDIHLLHEVYQHLVFDFRIWSRCNSQVCLAHVEYLHSLIKEDRKYFRKKYGVQFVLDTVRMFFGTPSSTHLSGECKQEIRSELLSIVHFYVAREINASELGHILAFVAAVQDEVLVSDVLGVVKSLLEARGKRDQIYLLLFEPGMADMLYVLLTIKDYSVELKEKIFQIMALLLKTDRVYERNKSRLRLVDSNLFPGLVSLMVDTQPSVDMTRHMLDQVFIAESSASINAAIYIIQTLHLCDVDVKLEAVRQLMKVILSKSTIPKLFAKQLGWQIALIRLLIRRPTQSTTSKWRSSFDESDSQRVVQRDDSVDDPPERLIELPQDDESSIDPKSETDDLLLSKFSVSSDFDPYALPDGRSTRSFSIVSCPDAAEDVGFDFSRGPSRSPSLFSSLSLGSDSRSRAPIKDGNESDAVMIALKELGLSVKPCAESMEKTEELCLNLLIVLFLILWKGIDQADEASWQQRGQVFAAITSTSEDNELLMSKTELIRKLLELLLQGCLIDIQDTGISNVHNSKNALNLVKLLYHFLCLDNGLPTLKFSKQLLEDLMVLLEDFSIWQTGCEWKEMEQMALRCLLAFAAQDNSDLCGIAAARLHAMVRDRPVEKFQESCFLVGTIDDILERALHGSGDQYGFLIQVMKSLLEKCDDLLNIPSYLPSLPTIRNSTSFMEAFKTYSRSDEWIAFIKKQVQPSKDQYLVNIYEGLRIQMTAFMGECHEEMMVDGHKRNREKGEAKLKFEEEFVSTFRTCSRQENKRFKSIRLQLHNQGLAAWRQWTATKAFFTSERGLWPDKNTFPAHWKLSLNENYSRMRPKMIPNDKFDNHLEASRLRDNEATEETSLAVSALSLMNEVRAKESAGDDRLEDDDWNLISGTDATNAATSNKESMLSEECELVTITEVIKGRLDVTTSHIYFFDCTPLREDGGIVDLKWSLDEIKEIHFRRHNLQRSALELFLVDQTNYFINFQKKVRNKVYSRILSLRPPNLIYNQSRSPAELLKASGLTQKWIQLEISNFDYLMCLNTIAGRTYNDLSQYPVFPWVLSDYTSETLDLNDPRSYRDLSLPIGVNNSKNEKQVREKYEHFEDPTGTVAKFHYGTHYSNPAGVMHYLIRVEPFTTLHIQLQSGRFDVADRQFNSVPAMWDGLMDNPNDVKELIPEFFYLPEFLVNLNDFDLGRLQFGEGRVDDVILPRWASTPYEFIHKHRMALESDYVSEHLHNWIDLIFGYKQQGPAAIEALNVFYYCTYEGAVDLDAVTDEKRRRAFEGMINNFGQTPCQLLKEPHPKRMTLQEITSRITKPERLLKVFLFPDKLNTFTVEAAPQNDPLVFVMIPPRSHTTSFITHWTTENMVAVTESGILCTHGWLPYDKNISGFFTFDRDLSMNNIKTRKKLPGLMMPGLKVTSKMFALSHDAKLLFSCGHWDNSLRVYNLTRNKQVAHVVRHRDIVTCVSLDRSSRRLISGSCDTTCMIWEVVHQGGASFSINPQPLHVLYGHDDHVTCVAIATELDMAVSGSRDGTVIVHTVKQGTYLRTLRPPYEKGWQLNIQLLSLSYMGQICVYCQHSQRNSTGLELDKLSLHLYSVNGKHLSKELLQSPISDMVITGDNLILGHINGLLLIKELYGLCLLSTIQYHQPVTCVAVANEGSHVLCALADSSLIVVAVKRSSP